MTPAEAAAADQRRVNDEAHLKMREEGTVASAFRDRNRTEAQRIAWADEIKRVGNGKSVARLDWESRRRYAQGIGASFTEPAPSEYSGDGDIGLENFLAYMPMHSYIFIPTREMWPAASINARFPKRGKMEPSEWLDKFRSVEQIAWLPGDTLVITDTVVDQGGRIACPGSTVFNLYRPPQDQLGDANRAGPWLDHLRRVYPDDANHIICWLAHRVQLPHQKINHALVLGGSQGIGKDTILEPVKRAVGDWNFADISPSHLLGRFNGFVKSVILRISEARDLGDVDRYSFYDHSKIYTAAPPDVLRVDEKNLREHAVANVCGVIITTNHKSDGIYLPSDDRRHFVAWSSLTKEDFTAAYWQDLYRWYESDPTGLTGHGHVAAYLNELDITSFDPKAPPPKTSAWHEIVDASRAPEDAELADVLDSLGNPVAVTLMDLTIYASEDFRDWLKDRRNRRQIPHRLESAGYVPVRNDADVHDGQWKVGGRRQSIYAKKALTRRDQIIAATTLCKKAIER